MKFIHGIKKKQISQLYSNLNTRFIRFFFNFVRHLVREAAGYISLHGEEMISKLDYMTNYFGQFIIIRKLKIILRVVQSTENLLNQSLHSMAFRKGGLF